MSNKENNMLVSFIAHISKGLKLKSTGYIAIGVATIVGVVLAVSLDSYFSFILAMIFMYAMAGIGLNILLGLSGQISFGHVGFFAIGAYTSAILMLNGVSFWIALIAAGAVSAIAGFLLALPALRVAGPYLAMMTIAFAFIIEHGAIEWRALTGGANGLSVFTPPEFFGHAVNEVGIAVIGAIFTGLSLIFYFRLSHGTWGKSMRAVRDSEIAAQSIGLNPVVLKTVAFALSALLTGVAGALFTPLNGFISPTSFPFIQSILFILAVVVGGAGTLWGPIFGAVLVVLLPEMLSDFAEYRLLIFGSLLLGVLWLAPKGLLGTIAGFFKYEDPHTAQASDELVREFLQQKSAGKSALEVADIGIAFGGVQAAKDVSLQAAAGKVTSIIGPNGAGKTTVLNMVSGFYVPDSGSIKLNGREIAGAKSFNVARLGVSRTYQTTLLFEDMSVINNLLVALDKGKLGHILSDKSNAKNLKIAESLLAFVGYQGPVARLASELPHVDKRLVEVARSLASSPQLLLLDEPAAGLMRDDKVQLGALLRKIASLGIVVVLVEHDMSLVMDVSDHVVVLDAGHLLMAGTPLEVQNDERVMEAYLGGADFEGRPRAEPWDGEMVATLTALKLEAGYGAAPVLEDVKVNIYPGEMVAVLGANGAGKSTFLRAVSGLHRPIKGSVILNEEEMAHHQAHTVAANGLVLVPEGRQLFPELTVMDNIMLGAFSRKDKVSQTEIDALLNRFPRLKDRIGSKAGVLSGGEQQMVAIARGLIAQPEALLLDEPSLGLAPSMIGELYDILADLRDEGVTILIVDQMANLALTVADRGYVLENGRVIQEGSSKMLKDDPSIKGAYLGH